MSSPIPDGTLILAGAPIGRAADASARLGEVLLSADVIAAEDTRRLHRLTGALGIRPRGRIVSFHESVEDRRTPDLLDRLRAGDTVVVITDAGMPSVSDPGYRLVAAAAAEGIRVTSVPGPSAVTTALAVSGLPCDRFCFEGFLPRKAGERRTRLQGLAVEPRTMVFFEAPHRLVESLQAMVEAFGPDRRAVVCRELTKTYEDVRRGTLAELSAWAEGEVLGEITVVVAGHVAGVTGDPSSWATDVAALVAAGEDRKAAIAAVAKASGVPKREVYQAVVTGADAAQ